MEKSLKCSRCNNCFEYYRCTAANCKCCICNRCLQQLYLDNDNTPIQYITCNDDDSDDESSTIFTSSSSSMSLQFRNDDHHIVIKGLTLMMKMIALKFLITLRMGIIYFMARFYNYDFFFQLSLLFTTEYIPI